MSLTLPTPLSPEHLTDFLKGVELCRTPAGEAFAVLCRGDQNPSFPLSSPEFAHWLTLRLFQHLQTLPSRAQVADMLGLLEAQAQLFGKLQEPEIATLPEDDQLAAALRQLFQYAPGREHYWRGPASHLLTVLRSQLPTQAVGATTWASSEDALVCRLRHAGRALRAQKLDITIISYDAQQWIVSISNRNAYYSQGATNGATHENTRERLRNDAAEALQDLSDEGYAPILL